MVFVDNSMAMNAKQAKEISTINATKEDAQIKEELAKIDLMVSDSAKNGKFSILFESSLLKEDSVKKLCELLEKDEYVCKYNLLDKFGRKNKHKLTISWE
jgi:hypothetical protein